MRITQILGGWTIHLQMTEKKIKKAIKWLKKIKKAIKSYYNQIRQNTTSENFWDTNKADLEQHLYLEVLTLQNQNNSKHPNGTLKIEEEPEQTNSSAVGSKK